MLGKTTGAALVAATALIGGLLAAGAAQAQWKPTKPITIIVPWAAGGLPEHLFQAGLLVWPRSSALLTVWLI